MTKKGLKVDIIKKSEYMTQTTPEQKAESTPTAPSEVKEVPETPEIPPHIERAGVSSSVTSFTAKVTDDSGKSMVQSPANQVVTITLPSEPAQLEALAKGNPLNAVTWFARFWLRMIKKALHFGWKIVTKAPAPEFLIGKDNSQQTTDYGKTNNTNIEFNKEKSYEEKLLENAKNDLAKVIKEDKV
jgi:hypothetical protein